MKKMTFFAIFWLCMFALNVQAEGTIETDEQAEELSEEQWRQMVDSLESRFTYQYGSVALPGGIGTIAIPEGFKYLDAKQSRMVLTELWGNPDDSTTLGMLFPADKKMFSDEVWGFDIEYEDIGYVKDKDANKIDYNDLLKTMQEESAAANPLRVQMGYEPIELVGWAVNPYYDKDKKILHWAKELKFGTNEENTLNYNIRKLGREGVLTLNAIASMSQLPEVQAELPKVLGSFEFAQGMRYADFNPKSDKVAQWTIGGLVAGKILAKAGFFAALLKFWKLIAVGVVGLGGVFAKMFGKKSKA